MAATDLARAFPNVTEIRATKGKKVLHLKVPRGWDSPEIVDAVIGPSGNLRAPAIVRGTTLLVGFDEAMFTAILLD